MTHEDYIAMLPLHALSTLDREEAQALENHLSACSECRTEMDEWQATASALAYAVPANALLEPSTDVRDHIIARVRAEAADAREAKPSNVVPISRAALRPASPRPAIASFQAIAAVVVFFGLILGVVVLWRQNREAKVEVARLGAQVADTRKELDQEHKALEFFTQTGMHTTELAGTSDAPTAHAILAVDRKTGHAMLMAHGLPQAPAGKAYQLWFIAGSHPMPGKVFQADASGSVMMDDQLPTEALSAGAFAVTLEPQGGVAAPTGKMYLITPTAL